MSQIVAWARAAGQLILPYFNKSIIRYRKADRSFVTHADLEVEQFLVERIRTAFPDDGLLSEENDQLVIRRSLARVWALDPLDGTTAFVQGLPGWGIAIGLLEQGYPCFGLFYMPLLDDMTYSSGPGRVSNNETILQQTVQPRWGDKGFLAVNASAHHHFQINLQRTRTLGSVGANLVYTARGVAAGALIPRGRLWDLAAGAAILLKAGGELRYLSGRKIDYLQLMDGQSASEPIIAGHPDLLTDIQNAIRVRSDYINNDISGRRD